MSPDFQIHEKEEEEMNEKNENANCLNEEPLITADQVRVWHEENEEAAPLKCDVAIPPKNLFSFSFYLNLLVVCATNAGRANM